MERKYKKASASMQQICAKRKIPSIDALSLHGHIRQYYELKEVDVYMSKKFPILK
jgi:hypothetical protein